MKLRDFSIAFEFVIQVAVSLKGEDSNFWREELRDYKIRGKCLCGGCYSFYLQPSEDDVGGAFARGFVYEHFADTLVILHENEVGSLTEVELPQITHIPFLDEYKNFMNDVYKSHTSPSDARTIVADWIIANPIYKPFVLVIA